MTLSHPLDRPVWSALTSRQAPLALGDRKALRFDPAFALFAAAADNSPEGAEALGRLNVSPNGLGLVEAGDMPLPPGAVVRASAACVQMVAASLNGCAGTCGPGHCQRASSSKPEFSAGVSKSPPGLSVTSAIAWITRSGSGGAPGPARPIVRVKRSHSSR